MYLYSIQLSALYLLSRRVREKDLVQNRESAINVLKEGRKQCLSLFKLLSGGPDVTQQQNSG